MQAADLSDEDDEYRLPVMQMPAAEKRTLAERSKICEDQPKWDSDDDVVPVNKKKRITTERSKSINFATKRLFSATCKQAQEIAFEAIEAGYEVEVYNLQKSTIINVPPPHAAVYGVYEYREKDCAGVAMDVSELPNGQWDYGHDELVGVAVAAGIIASSFKENPDHVVIVTSERRGQAARTLAACASSAIWVKFKHNTTAARRIVGARVCNPSEERLKKFCEQFPKWDEVEEQASKFYRG